MSKEQEQEFLKLAGTMLACRWVVMGGYIEGADPQPLYYSLLGMNDYAEEMKLLILEAYQERLT